MGACRLGPAPIAVPQAILSKMSRRQTSPLPRRTKLMDDLVDVLRSQDRSVTTNDIASAAGAGIAETHVALMNLEDLGEVDRLMGWWWRLR